MRVLGLLSFLLGLISLLRSCILDLSNGTGAGLIENRLHAAQRMQRHAVGLRAWLSWASPQPLEKQRSLCDKLAHPAARKGSSTSD